MRRSWRISTPRLETLANIGTGGVTTATGTMTAGIGHDYGHVHGRQCEELDVPEMTVPSKTTSADHYPVTTTTAGVTADGRNAEIGSLCVNTSNGALYVNSGIHPRRTGRSWSPGFTNP
jgi:hypothetical protein